MFKDRQKALEALEAELLREEEEEEQAAIFANTWVDGIAMPDASGE